MTHIGFVDISTLDEGTYNQLYALASLERQQRADRYLRHEDARRCIIADGLMRWVLGPDQLSVSTTKRGKPFLPGREDLHFNLSHSGRWVVIAWSDRPVGIDVETVQMDESKESLARRFFHQDEQDYLFYADGQERGHRFFEIWTKKESYLKYLGTGIDRPLNSFCVFQLPEVIFHCYRFEDAVVTLCSTDPECQILPLTPKMLLGE